MNTTIFLSNRFDALSIAFANLLENCSDLQGLFSKQAKIIVPSPATADYLYQRICDLRTTDDHAGCVTQLSFEGITRFVEKLAPANVTLLKRNIIFATLIDLEKQKPEFQDKPLDEKTIARLSTAASQIEHTLYANTYATRNDRQKWKRFCQTAMGERTQQILDYIAQKFERQVVPVLPFDLLVPATTKKQQEMQLNFHDLPQYVFWFDPEPPNQFIQNFLGKLIEAIKLGQCTTNLSIFAFSPCDAYWDDIKTGHNLMQRNPNDVSSESDEEPMPENYVHFLITRCGRIAQCVGRAMHDYLCTLETDGFSIHLPGSLNASLPKFTSSSLHVLQREALTLSSIHAIQLDDSLRICAFESSRESCAWIAKEIQRLLDEDQTLYCEDITVLVPSSIASSYAAFLHAALSLLRIKVNIRGIINTNQETCFDAFSALIPLLNGQFTRKNILDWLFLPAIMPQSLRKYKDVITSWIDRHGILRDLDGEHREEGDYLAGCQDYTWQQGLHRIALGFVHNDETLDTPLPHMSDDERLVCLRWMNEVRALFEDVRQLRQANLTWPDWQRVIYGVLSAWICNDARNRDEELEQIQSAMETIWPVYQFNWKNKKGATSHIEYHNINEVIPMLKLISERLMQSYTGQMLGGIQVRPLTPDVQTSRIVFMVGLENENFPSKSPRNKVMERFSRYDIDAHAFLKWVNNAVDKLYLCGRMLDIGEREVFRAQLDCDDQGKNRADCFKTACDHLAKRASVFLSDFIVRLALPDDNAFWPIPAVEEPVDRERIAKIQMLRKFVQQELNKQNENAPNSETARIPGEWQRIADVLTQNGLDAERVYQAIYNDKIRVQYKALDDPKRSQLSAEKQLSFNKFASFLHKPRQVYRSDVLGIEGYENQLPSSLQLLECEPFETNDIKGHFETILLREELLNVHLSRFTTAEALLPQIMADFDHLTFKLRAEGAWPAGGYADIQRYEAEAYFKSVFTQVQNCIEEKIHLCLSEETPLPGYIYTINNSLKRARIDVLQQPLFREISLPPFTFGDDQHTISYQLQGMLPTMLHPRVMVVRATSSKPARVDLTRITMSLLLLAVAKEPLPNFALILPKDAKGVLEIYNLSTIKNQEQFDHDCAVALITFLCRFIDAGAHEFGENGIHETKKPLSFDFKPKNQEASEIYKYVGSDKFVPQATLDHWAIWLDSTSSDAPDYCWVQKFLKLRTAMIGCVEK